MELGHYCRVPLGDPHRRVTQDRADDAQRHTLRQEKCRSRVTQVLEPKSPGERGARQQRLEVAIDQGWTARWRYRCLSWFPGQLEHFLLVSCKFASLSMLSCNMNEEVMRKQLAVRMKKARIDHWGPKQANLARALKVSGSQISRWERGESTPRITELARFAAACNTPIDALLHGFSDVRGEQLLLDLEPAARAVVVDLVEYLKRPRRVRGA